jgi:hypothetical protein
MLAVALVLVLVLVVVPRIKERVVSEARARGIELGFDELEVSLGHLSIENARFRLIGVRGLAGTAQRIDITVTNFEPTGLHLEQLHLELLGSVPSFALEFSEWTKNYPEAYVLPLSANPVSLRWRTDTADDPWLVAAGGKVGRNENGGSFQATTALLAGVPLGSVQSSWSSKQSRVSLGFGEVDPKKAPITVEVDHGAPRPSATITLNPTRAEKLADPLGVELPVKDVSVSALVKLEFEPTRAFDPVVGDMQITLDGYVPPHPPELNGFVFGKQTRFSSKFEVSQDRTRVELSDTRVKAGAFELKGNGEAQRYPDHARVRLELKGNLACVALANAAADSHLGQTLASLAKRIVKKTIQGGVAVTVKIDADTRKLGEARVLKLIGIGCGLQPLRLPTPEELEGFAKELPEFAGKLPAIMGELPPLPSGLPGLPSALPPAPEFRFPKFEVPLDKGVE